MTREFYCVSLKSSGRKKELPIREMSRPNKTGKKMATKAMVVISASAEKHGRPHLEPTSKVVPVPLDPSCTEQTVQVGKDLNPIIKDEIAKLLEQYKDAFAFDPSEMPGLSPKRMEHKLCVDPSQKWVIQKRRCLG